MKKIIQLKKQKAPKSDVEEDEEEVAAPAMTLAERRARVLHFQKTGKVIATARVQRISRALVDTSEVQKLTWYWWHRHFRVAQYSTEYAKQCWQRRVNELGQPVRSYKVNGERYMEIKGMVKTALEKRREDAKETVKTKAGGKMVPCVLDVGQSTEADLGQGELSDWDPDASSDDDPDAGPSEADQQLRHGVDNMKKQGGGAEAVEPPESAEEDDDALMGGAEVVPSRVAPSRMPAQSPTPTPTRKGGSPVVSEMGKDQTESAVKDRVAAQKRPPTPTAPRPPAAKHPRQAEGAVVETPPAVKGAAAMRVEIAACSDTFEESIDMWWMQDLMVDAVETCGLERKVPENLCFFIFGNLNKNK